MTLRAPWVLSVFLISACAAPQHGQHGQQGSLPAQSAPPAAHVDPRPDQWSGRLWEDKHDLMSGIVLPEMSRLFQRYYNAPDASMKCTDCHGDDAEEVAYKMPHGLPAFDPQRMPDPREDEAKFMAEQVTPKMIELLGKPAYDPATGKGFGCFSCHPKREHHS